jgi:hypothetical protein
MAILIPDLIPKNVFLKMTMILPDDFKLESVVTVRRIIKQGRENDYLHGIEFLNPSPEMIEHIEKVSADILSCNERTKKDGKEICVDACGLRSVCKRPQCAVKNIQSALIKFTQELKEPPTKPPEPVPAIDHSDWLKVRDQFKKFFEHQTVIETVLPTHLEDIPLYHSP